VLRTHDPHQWHAGLLLAALTVTWGVNAAYTVRRSTIHGLDPTTFAFAVSGGLIAYGFVCFGLLDIRPIARDAIFESIADAVVVLDANHTVIDFNPAAAPLLAGGDAIDSPARGAWTQRLLLDHPQFMARLRAGMNTTSELTLGIGAGARTYDVRVSPLAQRGGAVSGRLIMVRDITERRHAEAALAYVDPQLPYVIARALDRRAFWV
jgi:PAS domain S-box-containing protein